MNKVQRKRLKEAKRLENLSYRQRMMEFIDVISGLEIFYTSQNALQSLKNSLFTEEREDENNQFVDIDTTITFHCTPDKQQVFCSFEQPDEHRVTVLLVSLHMKYRVNQNESNIDNMFEDYLLELIVKGWDVDYQKVHGLMTWHLDYDSDATKGENGEKASFIHPLFHMHTGGKRITSSTNFDYGNLLLLAPPRLPHPPLDLCLGINFIIQNFFVIEEKDKTDSSENYTMFKVNSDILQSYNKYVESSANFFLSPYYSHIANYVTTNDLHPTCLTPRN